MPLPLPSLFVTRRPLCPVRLVKQGVAPVAPSPCLARFLARWVLTTAFLFLCLARASFAEYTVVYSNPANPVTITGPNGVPWYKDYAGQPPAARAGSAVSANPPPRPHVQSNADVGTVTCSGAITATFTWAGPASEIPQSVVIKETAAASWSGSSGMGSDGLGGTATGSDGGSFQTVKYSVKQNPGASFTMTCSPSPNGALPVASDILCASASVSYSVEWSSVTIGLGGTTVVENVTSIMIGQGCTASLSASPAQLSNYNWTISGDKFGDFVAEYDSMGGIVSGGPLPVDPDFTSQEHPHW